MNDNLLEIVVDLVHKILNYLGNVQKAGVANIFSSCDTSRDFTSKRARPDCGIYGDDLDMGSNTP